MPIETKTIAELTDFHFFVPSYQRGYRWTKSEVVALLNDINEFPTEDGKKSYCLQPLIVKRRPDDSFEVVDGQQRLTTVYIFMQIARFEMRSAVLPYELRYETRDTSADFLKSLTKGIGPDRENNIDFHHIAFAYEEMNEWFNRQNRASIILKLYDKIMNNVYFIWHEIPQESEPIEIFTKVNLGKIPLTCAELIKALLLSKDNFNGSPPDIYKRQIEISTAWDRIEQGLQEDSFWYFLNEKEQDGTRIDLLFNLLADEYNARLRELGKPVDTNEKYFSFLVFLDNLNDHPNKKKNEFIDDLWNKVERLYAEFRGWYSDLNTYHIIGFLISSKAVKLGDIVKLTRGKRKSDTMSLLLKKANSTADKLDQLASHYTCDHPRIESVLLLFNIATLVCKSEKQYRFPFDIYKKEEWDIEHIHATADATGEADDSIGNLTLLDEHTNREYKNAYFDKKREIIIKRESNGRFVPLCTKNVFLKVYSNPPGDMNLWTETDKQNYVSVMEQTFEAFFKGDFLKCASK